MLLKPAAALAVSEVSKKSHPAHPTFLSFWLSFWTTCSTVITRSRGIRVLGQLSMVSMRPAIA